MNKILKSERRIHPRIDHTLPIKLAVNGYDFSTTTQNISCLGAYCRVEKYVPPFTRLAVRMSLPVVEADSARKLDIECKGVIVRSEDAPDGGFNIAVFFNQINNSQRQKISQYISQFLPK
ncbi:MAG: PilZ domain-containing protein [Candidatus Omnitrophica bacterium]|nr:PilZ domain-containing protein [Candidatus Omnitrophota bacterium]